MYSDLLLQVIHMAGTRIKVECTDGLSQGDISEGVLKGLDLLSFVPLQLTAIERSPQVKIWVKGWFGQKDTHWLATTDWYKGGQTCDKFTCPPPRLQQPKWLWNYCQSLSTKDLIIIMCLLSQDL
jgi:hypothetical protein